jgi:hypothetical protein
MQDTHRHGRTTLYIQLCAGAQVGSRRLTRSRRLSEKLKPRPDGFRAPQRGAGVPRGYDRATGRRTYKAPDTANRQIRGLFARPSRPEQARRRANRFVQPGRHLARPDAREASIDLEVTLACTAKRSDLRRYGAGAPRSSVPLVEERPFLSRRGTEATLRLRPLDTSAAGDGPTSPLAMARAPHDARVGRRGIARGVPTAAGCGGPSHGKKDLDAGVAIH